MDLECFLRALANNRRLQILEYLKKPRKHFPDQAQDGVCGLAIARKLKISQPAASEHLHILVSAGLIRARRTGQWTFYRRDKAAIRDIKRLLSEL